MERYKCKLCLKNFANGRALGGHMRSHMLNLYVNPKTQLTKCPAPAFSSSSSEENGEEEGGASAESQEDYEEQEEEDEEEEEEEEEQGLFGYGSRQNIKKSVRLVDPKFSSIGSGGGSVVLQDRESETESSRKATARRRSKRIRKAGIVSYEDQQHCQEKPKLVKLRTKTAEVDREPVSSMSDTTPEVDIAYCLMMLSRDKWVQENQEQNEYDEDEEQEYEITDNEYEGEMLKAKRTRGRAKYRCETCSRVFRSYQALGGHRASHKKIKLNHRQPQEIENEEIKENVVEEKIHECPVCFRVFASGQALGGHKRSHVTGSSAKPVAKQCENKLAMIDLNLPAPIDEDDDGISQNELSVVSDGEFVKTH